MVYSAKNVDLTLLSAYVKKAEVKLREKSLLLIRLTLEGSKRQSLRMSRRPKSIKRSSFIGNPLKRSL